jgi:Protein of unknown function (DUF2867)
MVEVRSVAPSDETRQVLAGAQFADAFSLTVEEARLDARTATERMVGHSPQWVSTLLALRNLLVAPFGLKTRAPDGPHETIGLFPVVSQTAGRLVAGFDDKHLDFRVIVDVGDAAGGRRVTATTLVMTHNLLGRAYHAAVLPFHRLVVPAMLRQVAVAP